MLGTQIFHQLLHFFLSWLGVSCFVDMAEATSSESFCILLVATGTTHYQATHKD